jgi:hypothetical protein
MYIYSYICIYIHIYVYIYMNMYTYSYICIYIHVCACACACVCVCVCVYEIYITPSNPTLRTQTHQTPKTSAIVGSAALPTGGERETERVRVTRTQNMGKERMRRRLILTACREEGHTPNTLHMMCTRGRTHTPPPSLSGFSFPFYPFYVYNKQYHYGFQPTYTGGTKLCIAMCVCVSLSMGTGQAVCACMHGCPCTW